MRAGVSVGVGISVAVGFMSEDGFVYACSVESLYIVQSFCSTCSVKVKKNKEDPVPFYWQNRQTTSTQASKSSSNPPNHCASKSSSNPPNHCASKSSSNPPTH